MTWDKQSIIQRLRQLHRSGKPLAYSQLAERDQSLLSAAAYHFGSYRKAIEKAGIDYADVIQRPRWTRQRIIQLIKQARRKNQDLHWSAVIARTDELKRAAFASIQPRLFGTWVRALHASGLDAEEIAVYRTWDRNTIVAELRSLASDGASLSSGKLQKQEPDLHAAAVRYFGAHDKALRAAGLDPSDHRLRKRWDRKQVIKGLRECHSNGHRVTDTLIRRQYTALYGAAARLFGSFTAARKAAGIKVKGKKRK